jgi:hypothetical protein
VRGGRSARIRHVGAIPAPPASPSSLALLARRTAASRRRGRGGRGNPGRGGAGRGFVDLFSVQEKFSMCSFEAFVIKSWSEETEERVEFMSIICHELTFVVSSLVRFGEEIELSRAHTAQSRSVAHD